MSDKTALTLLLTALTLFISSAGDSLSDALQDSCGKISSCSLCLNSRHCVWCVLKSQCNKESCGNDSVIYPKHIMALIAGAEFCPRIVEPEKEIVIKSGNKVGISIKITQIYVYMAFTPWKCKFDLGGKEKIVMANLLGDTVSCNPVVLNYETDQPYVNGTVAVLWDYKKNFDGLFPIKVCKCDLDPTCTACK